jgi:hypothetical protein
LFIIFKAAARTAAEERTHKEHWEIPEKVFLVPK